MLNKKGIRKLADDLVVHKKMYDQNTYGDIEDCGTVCCLAGFCYWREVGTRKFNRMVRADVLSGGECVEAGIKQLGISRTSDPKIFESVDGWPTDLYDEYLRNGPRGRVIVALKALQRLKPSGAIDRKKSAVHTRLPQLKKLLTEQQREHRERDHEDHHCGQSSDHRYTATL